MNSFKSIILLSSSFFFSFFAYGDTLCENETCTTYERYADSQNKDLIYAQQAYNITSHQDNQSTEDINY